MAETKTLPQVADDLEIPANTIKTWLHQLDFIPAEKDGAGRWRFGPEAEEVLRGIQSLRLDGRSLSTVRQRLGARSTDAEQEAPHRAEDVRQERDEPRSAVDERSIVEVINQAVASAVQEQAGLSERYARAAHEIGALTERVAGLTAQLEAEREAHGKTRAVLTAGVDEAQAGRERMIAELAEARAKVAVLEAAQTSRAWWKFWG